MIDQPPLPIGAATRAILRCIAVSIRLLIARRLHQPTRFMGRYLHFADGSSARVYRETVVDGPPPESPTVLVVGFRLRWVRGWGHTVFRWESLLNTPLFVGFPGFVSKLWLAHDDNGLYRGVYQWDGPGRAEDYARALWWILALVSVRDSIGYQVLPGRDRDDVLAAPQQVPRTGTGAGRQWWCIVG